MAFLPRRLPLIPTLLVALAALAMIGLGIWQFQRHQEKKAVIAVLQANLGKPAIAFPMMGPVDATYLFRRSSLQCLRVEDWKVEAGKAADGTTGFRSIAHCSTGAEGPGALVELGVAARPDIRPVWTGGVVRGRIVEEPDHRSLLAHLVGPKLVLRPMLIADASPDSQLKTSARPSVQSIPDNHFGYALQWFSFAALAVLIYIFALVRRQRQGDSDS